MGSKVKPGQFDCYANALPDEPMFVLLARDPLAPLLTGLWAAIRTGDDAQFDALVDQLRHEGERYRRSPESAKAGEALSCAFDMQDWRARNDGAWRTAGVSGGRPEALAPLRREPCNG